MTYRNPESYIPKTRGEIWDFLGHLMLSAPTFVDKTGYFANRNVETEFFALDEGLRAIRKEIGEGSYRKLAELSARMRTHFEADPENRTGECREGRKCIEEMEDILVAIDRHRH